MQKTDRINVRKGILHRVSAATIPFVMANLIGCVASIATSQLFEPPYNTNSISGMAYLVLFTLLITHAPLALGIFLSEWMGKPFRTKFFYGIWLFPAWILTNWWWIFLSFPEQYWHYDPKLIQQAESTYTPYFWAMTGMMLFSAIWMNGAPKFHQRERVTNNLSITPPSTN